MKFIGSFFKSSEKQNVIIDESISNNDIFQTRQSELPSYEIVKVKNVIIGIETLVIFSIYRLNLNQFIRRRYQRPSLC
jgi:hypothetical protein